jgi:hypothetical protein
MNTEQALTTGTMQLTAHAFEPPASKPFPLWAIVCAVVALALAANIVYSWLQPAQPPARSSAAASKPRENAPTPSVPPFVRDQGLSGPGLSGASAAPPTAGRPIPGRAGECATLDHDIQALDAAARVLLATDQQNAIRASKAKGRSRQLALGC